MGCTNSEWISNLRARLATKEATLVKAQAALDAMLDAPILEYGFNSTEASQKVKRRKLSEFQEVIAALEAEISGLRRELCGIGVHAIRLRRT